MNGFGAATPFRDFKSGEHLPPQATSKVNIGNIFASANQLQFKRTSRVDDLESLCLVLIYLMQDPVKMPHLHFPKATIYNDRAKLIFMQSFRKSFNPEKMCNKSKAYMLQGFCHEVQRIKYKSKPDYRKFRYMLQCLIMHEK